MDLTEIAPRELHAGLHWLGRIPDWVEYHRAAQTGADGLPRTNLRLHDRKVEAAPDHPLKKFILERLRQRWCSQAMTEICYLEAASRLVADGPKFFMPNAEQFESMCHVELQMDPREFRSPYPAILVGVPPTCRDQLGREYGVPAANVPRMVLIRHWFKTPEDSCVVAITRFPQTQEEEFHLFTPSPLNPTIEEAISRVVETDEITGRQYVKTEDDLPPDVRGGKILARILVRAALNLCLMLTHYGHRVRGPLDPAAYEKHRKKKHLRHLAHGDFLAVEMTQDVVVRRPLPPAHNPPGPGTAIEVKPHWRKGHWRCYPGQAARRAAGEEVPLLFVRPCLVRPDRIRGDVSESQVTYHG